MYSEQVKSRKDDKVDSFSGALGAATLLLRLGGGGGGGGRGCGGGF